MLNRRAVGASWEERVSKYLEAQGMRIVERNFRSRQGEIDLIGYHEGYLVFVEVKYRSSSDKGYASEAVGLQKQRRICRTADHYRYLHKLGENTAVRYDVVAIQGEEPEWIKNAFPHRIGGNGRGFL